MSDMRNFVLRDEDGNEHGVFTGKQPRQAALKAANRGEGTKSKPEIIRLRERGTKKVHVFKAWKQLVKAPENRPSMDARENQQALCQERENRKNRVNIVSIMCPENRGSFIFFSIS